ncbi:hypothetical protein EJ02DRAFT_484941 [Clathrospora elynae]|uniref:Uncharacterized protein n=1 Tax=Clathrospora elynae TaxID=706981 RepID=A0A6A5SU37_9PLEO|nr:hypothetical protein EJ02DRAFT_484941 [Clathrospora elynae]
MFAEPNPSVAKLIDSRYAQPWKGAILAIALQGTTPRPTIPRGDDVNMEDLRHVLDYLNTYKSTAVLGSLARYYSQTIRGVRINCVDDQTHNVPRDEFEEVCVPMTHRIFSAARPQLPIPNRLGIAIMAANYPRRVEYVEYRDDLQKTPTSKETEKRSEDWNSSFRDLRQAWLLKTAGRPR